jgi:ribosome maturation factor RimP
MSFAHQKLHGIDADRLIAVLAPVLRAHGVEGVELIWKTDQGGWLLELTIERPETRIPGAGITIELCSEISRDLSAALDVADVIPQSYRLQVGSPGVERALYGRADYARFAGQLAKLKLREPVDGQRVLRGTLHGLDDAGRVLIETERGELAIEFDLIDNARLVFDWGTTRAPVAKGKNPSRRANSRGRAARRS